VQDVLFGSEGTAQADFERMAEINNEIGLTQLLNADQAIAASSSDAEKTKAEESAEKEKV
jgi:hypothetical protein